MMEKEDELRAFAAMCVQALSDDAELRQERETELLVHLKSAFAEERRNAPDDEALKNTFRRFGDPEEVSSQLLDGNAEQLSRNARVRRAAKWLLLPMLVIGVLLCIDVRGILASSLVLKPVMFKILRLEQDVFPFDYSGGLKTRSLTAYEQWLFNFYYYKGRHLELAENLYATNPDDVMNCAVYAQELALSDISSQETRKKLTSVLNYGRRIDETNPLYDYIDTYVMMFNACGSSSMDGETLNGEIIKDCDEFERAVESYNKALGKGVFRTYRAELMGKIRGMLLARRDMLGGLHLLDFEARERLPYLTVCNGIAKRLPLYCERLHADGHDKRARELLGTWRTFLPRFLEGNHRHRLDLLACLKYGEYFLKSADKIGAEEDVASLKEILDVKKVFLDSIWTMDTTHLLKTGGVMSSYAAPFDAVDESPWKNERKLEAATFDIAALGLACVTILLIIVYYAIVTFVMRLNGRHPFLFVLPKESYMWLFLKGILLPGGICLLMSWLASCAGGTTGLLWQLVSSAVLCILWPICYGLLCRKAIHARLHDIGATKIYDFKASRSLNMLCLFIVLIVTIGTIMRPVQTWRQYHYAHQESLLFPWNGEETLEDKSVRNEYRRLMERLNSKGGI